MQTNLALVAVCDLLGFSEFVKTSPLDKIVSYDIQNINKIIKSSIPKMDDALSQLHLSERTIHLNGLVGHAIFSDTVLIYSLCNDRYGYLNLVEAVARLLSIPIFWPNYRYRIGIDYGEFYHNKDKGIYVGKAMVGANDLEKKQEWCGAAFSVEAEKRLNETGVSSNFLINYDVPVKGGAREKHLVINWTQAAHKIIDQEFGWFEREFDPANTQCKDAELKIRNTEQFHLDNCVQCRAAKSSHSVLT